MDIFLGEARVAYFTMEAALEPAIPTYSGGLGILAGDTLRSAVDLAVPVVGVTLVSRAGYFRQRIGPAGAQVEEPDVWDPRSRAQRLEAKVVVTLSGRPVWVGGWLYLLRGLDDARQPVLLLDADLEENHPEDRGLTHYLYGGDSVYRFKQEALLGIGGVRLLQALGFPIRQYHMNEGHSALLALELARRHAYAPQDRRPGEAVYDLPRVRELCNFTTHTPVEAGHDRFPYGLVEQVLGRDYFDMATLRALGGADELNLTRLALNLSEYVNGVAQRHAKVSEGMFPGYRVHAITNGVHPATWTSAPFQALYDRYLPGWAHEPELLGRADCCIPDAAVLAARAQAKRALIERVRELTGVALHPRAALLGFARRMTAYKRPDLLFSDLERVRAIAAGRTFQIVIAGKAHPRDAAGKDLIAAVHAHLRSLEGAVTGVFLPNYDMALAQVLTAGCDVWLNTPLPPLEASGTSGMKAAFNGVPSLSVLDGWWAEGCIEGVTGWAVGNGDPDRREADAQSLYDKLENVVLPAYYGYTPDPHAWIRVVKGAIARNASFFNTHRMMRRYVTEAYIR
jgi:glycogen phosphorylase